MRSSLLKILGILLFAAILLKIDVGQLLALLGSIDFLLYGFCLLLGIPIIGIKAFRWQLILRSHGIAYPYRDSFLAYMAATYLGFLTPGRLGEVIKVFYLKQDRGTGIGAGATSVLLDRVYDLIVLFIAGFAGMMLFALVGVAAQALFALAFLAIVIFVLTNRGLVKSLVLRGLLRFVPERHKGSVESHFNDFYANLSKFNAGGVLFNLLLTALAYGLLFYQAHLLAGLLGLDITYLFAMTSLALSNIINLLPVTISAGIGTRDAVIILLFRSQGLPGSSAVAFATLILGSIVFLSLAGLASWWFKPLTHRQGR